jgi:hypothetical protein
VARGRPRRPDPDTHLAQVAAARRRPDPAWARVAIPVDGRPVDFEWLAEGRHWVARAELDDRTLTLHARDLPAHSVELVRGQRPGAVHPGPAPPGSALGALSLARQ